MNKHTITKVQYKGFCAIVETIPKNCQCLKCIAERKEKQRIDNLHREQATELNCDKCNSLIGYVYECDLNGSYFYCINCKGG